MKSQRKSLCRKSLRLVLTGTFLLFTSVISLAQIPPNNLCAGATVLTSSITCVNTTGTLQNATTDGLASACGSATSPDVWYSFTAKSAYPKITMSGLGSSWGGASARMCIQLFSGSCPTPTAIACVTANSLDTRTNPGGAGLTPGVTYLIRIHKNTATAALGSNWGFSICITDPDPGDFDFGKSYVNLTKGTVGGTIDVGDTLEIRATFVARNINGATAADSLCFYDTLESGKGFRLISDPATAITLRTNESKLYKQFTQAADADAGDATIVPATSDTAIRINFGANATATRRGRLRNTSKPSVFGSTCIIMATYRVVVYAPYNTKINWGGGKISYRDSATGLLNNRNFKNDSLIVYSSPGLCPNAVSVTNAIGAEFNGTFGAPSGGTPLVRNRAASGFVPGYSYQIFGRNMGPNDYYYGITNNTSAEFGTSNTRPKKDVDPDGAGPMSYYRLFQVWDIMGDHTGAANTAKGNPPCDTTKPISPTNPCGYMLVVNSAYKTDTAFQYSVTNLCPNTYYEISAWVKNICSRCSCDSNGVAPGTAGYIPTGPSDSSGVQPNLAFDLNGIDYYTTGNIVHNGAQAGISTPGSDSVNLWTKRGFVYKTGLTETSFLLTIRNNAPGGGGNDWALDDVTVSTCLPNMSYSPTINPAVCDSNVLTIQDTVRSYFNNYVNYQWQRSTDGGVTWTDVPGASGTGVPVWNGSSWQFVASYTIPSSATLLGNNGDKYRLIVATTAGNLANPGCQVTDGVSIVTLNVIDCFNVLSSNLLSFSGKLSGDLATLSWTMTREPEPFIYTVERSTDGVNFTTAGIINSYRNFTAEINNYSFIDPQPVSGKVWYRLMIADNSNKKKTSNIIQLQHDIKGFDLNMVRNPFNGQLDFIVTSKQAEHFVAELIDMFGKTVRKNNYIAYPGVNSFSMINTGQLPSGMYTLRLLKKDTQLTRQVIKTN